MCPSLLAKKCPKIGNSKAPKSKSAQGKCEISNCHRLHLKFCRSALIVMYVHSKLPKNAKLLEIWLNCFMHSETWKGHIAVFETANKCSFYLDWCQLSTGEAWLSNILTHCRVLCSVFFSPDLFLDKQKTSFSIIYFLSHNMFQPSGQLSTRQGLTS